jgi:hypothetical protein
LAQMTTAPEFRLPPGGGYMDTARDMARLANERGQCLVIDGPLASASVLAARLVDCVRVVDPSAPWMEIHLAAAYAGGPIDWPSSARLFYEMGALGCLDWYRQQPGADRNRLARISWEFLDGDCND